MLPTGWSSQKSVRRLGRQSHPGILFQPLPAHRPSPCPWPVLHIGVPLRGLLSFLPHPGLPQKPGVWGRGAGSASESGPPQASGGLGWPTRLPRAAHRTRPHPSQPSQVHGSCLPGTPLKKRTNKTKSPQTDDTTKEHTRAHCLVPGAGRRGGVSWDSRRGCANTRTLDPPGPRSPGASPSGPPPPPSGIQETAGRAKAGHGPGAAPPGPAPDQPQHARRTCLRGLPGPGRRASPRLPHPQDRHAQEDAGTRRRPPRTLAAATTTPPRPWRDPRTPTWPGADRAPRSTRPRPARRAAPPAGPAPSGCAQSARRARPQVPERRRAPREEGAGAGKGGTYRPGELERDDDETGVLVASGPGPRPRPVPRGARRRQVEGVAAQHGRGAVAVAAGPRGRHLGLVFLEAHAHVRVALVVAAAPRARRPAVAVTAGAAQQLPVHVPQRAQLQLEIAHGPCRLKIRQRESAWRRGPGSGSRGAGVGGPPGAPAAARSLEGC